MESKPKFFATPAAFRRWLEANHASKTELWVGLWKKDSGKTGLTYEEAVDEALCYGWIDGLARSHDERAYKQRFTPRKRTSVWSAINLAKVARLKAAGRMAPPGLEAFEKRDPNRAGLYSFENRDVKLSPAFEKRFRASRKAWSFFAAQPPGYRRLMAFWVMSAKREETRTRRLAQLIARSAAGERIQ
jgi:uncharacterized protein YdeI (YjbR/CyaY-like superfamily)